MRKAMVVLLLGLVCVAPARAERAWMPVSPFSDSPSNLATSAVASDGTSVAAWASGAQTAKSPMTIDVEVDGHAPVEIGVTANPAIYVAAARGGQAVIAWSVGDFTYGLWHVEAAFARPDGTFTEPQDVGDGRAAALAINDAGQAVIGINLQTGDHGRDYQQFSSVAFRAPGGPFGTPTRLGEYTFLGLALSPVGETLVATSSTVPSLSGGGTGVQVFPRAADGALSAPYGVSDGLLAGLAIDGVGRSLAVATDADGTLVAASRSTDGTWSTQRLGGPGSVADTTAAANANGDVIIAWRDVDRTQFTTTLGALHAMTGTIGGTFSPPQTLDAATTSVNDYAGPAFMKVPYAGIGPDGTATIATADDATDTVRVVQRTGLGPWSAPQVAACVATEPSIAGIDQTGTTTLQANTVNTLPGLTHDQPGTAADCTATAAPTPPAGTPTVVSESASPHGALSLEMRATLNTGGSAGTLHFEYGYGLDYDSSTATQPIAASSADQEAVATIRYPTAGRTVYYRAVLTTNGHTTTGARQSFIAPSSTGHRSHRCRVPSVVGMTIRQARQTLKRNHCRLGRVHRRGKRKHRHIVAQSIRSARLVPPNTRVDVTTG